MKDYLYEMNENYSIIKQIRLSVIISFGLLALDALDMPSKIIAKYGCPVFSLISIGIIILIGLTIIEYGFIDMLRIGVINSLDNIIFVKLCSILIYIIMIRFMGELYLYKLIVLGVLLFLILIAAPIRIFKFNAAKRQSEEYKPNITDLKDLYEDNIKEFGERPIILDERDVEYDLLNRDMIINHLYDAIVSTNLNGSFVISLGGRWGSGKTTIIRNVKRMILEENEDVVIIDEFDPWIYSDEDALLQNMFNIIISKSGFKYSHLLTKKIAEDLSELILGTNRSSLIRAIFFENSIAKIKSKINNYLKMSEKKFVFFIDNIDRAEKENVILLFKLVGNILDFDRITYVLSFDDKRVKEIFERDLEIDSEYLKKIINLQIRIPEIDKAILSNIYGTTLKRILTIYGENKENLRDYNNFIDFICERRLDLRDFKRFINSAVNFSFKTNHYLYYKDLLIMEYIKLFNFSLYMTIFDNRQYFISHDRITDHLVYSESFNTDKFNSDGKLFYEKLFEEQENQYYKGILGEIFPYIDKYNKNQDLVYNGIVILKDSERIKISKNRQICSAKYFDLYFTATSNVYAEIGILVENFIEVINDELTLENKEKLFKEILSSTYYSYHNEIIEGIQLYIDEIKQDKCYDLAKILFKNIDYVDNSLSFAFMSSKERVSIIIHTLLNRISNYEYKDFLDSIKTDYRSLNFIQDILYWFINDKENINKDGRMELLKDTVKEMATDILNNSIDLYEDVNYMPSNIWGLYHAYNEELDKLKSYISRIINEKNIFRFLNDLISTSVGTKYRYYIKKDNLELFISQDKINTILSKIETKTDDEKFVLDVYRAFDEGVKDMWGEPGISVNQEKKLVL
ncbi:MAG: P-loop NTPase fold protein [Gudongella sp.]|nr:P-loop NTPase fold protein [Gudongella sp.]